MKRQNHFKHELQSRRKEETMPFFLFFVDEKSLLLFSELFPSSQDPLAVFHVRNVAYSRKKRNFINSEAESQI